MDFAVSADQRLKIEEAKRLTNTWPLPENYKKPVDHEGTGDTNCCWCTWNGHQKTEKKTGGIVYSGENRDHTDHSNFMIT